MTVLQALDGYYGRMADRGEAEPPGSARVPIGFAIMLSPEGEPVDVIDLRDTSGKKPRPSLREVPAAPGKRTSGISSNRFWDKTAYALGRTAGEGKRTAQEHAAFKGLHRDLLAGSDDPGLLALVRFVERWLPERFDAPPFSPEMLDANVVFRLAGDTDERGRPRLIHERPAARALLAKETGADDEATTFCLVTGERAPPQRLHPTIKGVEGAQTAGAALVSFNLDAFTSYGKEQGANAPTSEAASFKYGAALNRMLDRGSRNRLRRPIGDATVLFWADTSEKPGEKVGEEEAKAAEEAFVWFVDPPDKPDPDDDAQEAAKLRDALDRMGAGRPVAELKLGLAPRTRFHILGLSPNVARLSVRYWLDGTFEEFAARLAEHHRDLKIEPAPRGWTKPPAIGRLLVKTTALQEDFKNIQPLLAGEVARAVLGGTPYPRNLLVAAIIRLRAGDSSGWHAAVIKACLNRTIRNEKEKLPVALEPHREDAAYQLGRLFAVLESAQYAALGSVNAPIGDRYYAAASSTPARVFGTLLRGLKNHVADARKRGRGGWIEPKVAQIMAMLRPDLPRTLRLEEQGRFAIGYYHERGQRSPSTALSEDTQETTQ